MAFVCLILAGVIVMGVGYLVRVRQSPRPKRDIDSSEHFREHSQQLLETGKLDELITYARNRIAKRPNHTYAYWYLGRAFYLQQRWTEALASFNEVARLDPSWIEDSVMPHVRAIEAKLRPTRTPAATESVEQRTLH